MDVRYAGVSHVSFSRNIHPGRGTSYGALRHRGRRRLR
jgi:hypothetical protein